MSVASWFAKAFMPKKELLETAKQLVEMIEDDKEASKLLQKIDGMQAEICIKEELTHMYRNLTKRLVAQYNQNIQLFPIEIIEVNPFGPQWQADIKLIRLTNHRNINYEQRVNLLGNKDDERKVDRTIEAAYRQLFMLIAVQGLLSNNKAEYLSNRSYEYRILEDKPLRKYEM